MAKKTELDKEMIEEYQYDCWINSIEYFELTRGR